MKTLRIAWLAALGAAWIGAGCSAAAPEGADQTAGSREDASTGAPATDSMPGTPPAGEVRPPVVPSSKQPIESSTEGRYSDIQGARCAVVSVDREAGGSTHRCKGVEGFDLLVHDSDARMSLDVIAPGGSRTPLQLASLAGGGAFSSLGPRVEWRPVRGAPAALIVRFNAYEDPAKPDRPTSYLVVARLARGDTCAVARIDPGPDQNLRARQLADAPAGRACLQPGAR